MGEEKEPKKELTKEEREKYKADLIQMYKDDLEVGEYQLPAEKIRADIAEEQFRRVSADANKTMVALQMQGGIPITNEDEDDPEGDPEKTEGDPEGELEVKEEAPSTEVTEEEAQQDTEVHVEATEEEALAGEEEKPTRQLKQ